MNEIKKLVSYIITVDLKSFFYIIPMKIQALVSCDEFQYACVLEICRQSAELGFKHHFHFFIATHVHAAQKLFQVCEQVKITWSQVQTVGAMIKNVPGKVSK
jgi:hypothetical protein